MIQLILHLWGDYLLQSSWMANNKTKAWLPAIVHATIYSLPFLLIGSWLAVLVIWSTHAVIDRFRLARYLCWAKDAIALPIKKTGTYIRFANPANPDSGYEIPWSEWVWEGRKPWRECAGTGYSQEVPVWLSTWLMIIADNTLHLTINYLALKYL